jgi:DNA polymerase I-like protein with 3'-5' exonuclease and polymerase domains
VILSVDWSSAELHTVAEVCIQMGLDSVMARELNAKRDVHLSFGASMNGWTYEWAKEHKKDPQVKDARQLGKVGNFGIPGGLGALKLRLWAAKTYDVIMSQAEAESLKKEWLSFFSEFRDYFANVNDLIESKAPLRHVFSGRYRGDIRYTSACNSYFPGLAADMAKATAASASAPPQRPWPTSTSTNT